MDTLLQFLYSDFMGKAVWIWLLFIGIVVALLAFDLGVLHKKDHEIEVRESLFLSAGYISVALLFGTWVWWYLGAISGMEYFTGFLIEKSLSMDNVFVIVKIFLVGFIGKMPPMFSLSVIFCLIAGGVLVSLWKTRGRPEPTAIELK